MFKCSGKAGHIVNSTLSYVALQVGFQESNRERKKQLPDYSARFYIPGVDGDRFKVRIYPKCLSTLIAGREVANGYQY